MGTLESIEKLLLVTFLSKPEEVLSAIELFSKANSDNTPICYTFELDAGETFIGSVSAPEGYVGVTTGYYFDISVAGVIDVQCSYDGRPYVSASELRATAGGMDIKLMGWVTCARSEYKIINNHTSAVTIFFVSYGAWLLKDIWEKIAKILKDAGQQLSQEGKIG